MSLGKRGVAKATAGARAEGGADSHARTAISPPRDAGAAIPYEIRDSVAQFVLQKLLDPRDVVPPRCFQTRERSGQYQIEDRDRRWRVNHPPCVMNLERKIGIR